MSDANEVIHPQHFGTDLTDIRIRINHVIWMTLVEFFIIGRGLHSRSYDAVIFYNVSCFLGFLLCTAFHSIETLATVTRRQHSHCRQMLSYCVVFRERPIRISEIEHCSNQ